MCLAAGVVATAATPFGVRAQEHGPVLRGRALLGDTLLRSGVVMLHHVSSEVQGELDSTRVRPDGTFRFRLANAPDPDRSEVFFAAIRYQGVLYFGKPLTLAAQLDSIYEIHTYDTILVAAEGVDLPVEIRNLFLEPDSGSWRVTDLFQVRNRENRTLVARDDGIVWSYLLPEGARDFALGQGEFAPDAVRFEDGRVLVRSAIPPGDRLFVVRYNVPDPFLRIPMPGSTDEAELLVREPAPPLEVDGLQPLEQVELEPGTTYLRYSAQGLADATVTIRRGRGSRKAPVKIVAILIGFLLAAVGLWAVLGPRMAQAPVAGSGAGPAGGTASGGTSGGVATPAPGPGPSGSEGPTSRRTILVEIAKLDEAFESHAAPTPAERERYATRRRELIEQLRRSG